MVRTSTTMPNVSIVLPVFNGENKYLADTVKSVLNQSHEDFELIIIDDGSTDHTFSLLSDLSRSDSRIRLLQNEKNEGLVKSLNRALDRASSRLIARIDCGDIAHRERIELQYRFLQENHDYVLAASQAEWIAMNGETIFTTNVPCDDREIRKRLFLKDSVLIHPAVMFRKIPGLYYREIAVTAEDYDYWLRLSRYGKLFIINKVLLKMRLDPDGTTYSKKIHQVKTVDLIHDAFVHGLKNPAAQREWPVVKLDSLETLQERLFHFFTRYASRYYRESKFLYCFFKLLSGISSPYYMFTLVRMRLKRLTVSNDPLFHQYLSWAERSADMELKQ